MPVWEVAGVRFGMDAAQVEAVLRQRGYQIGDKRMTFSFDERVQDALGRTVRTSSAVGDLEATKADERVKVYFAQTASGPSVSRVWYRVPAGQVSGAEAIAALKPRLGAPVAKRSASGRAVWCKDGSNPRWCDQDTPSIEVSSQLDDDTSIMMKAGDALHRRSDAELEAATRASPNRVKPSF